jgi:L-lysine exporter family protein LysE/ArgO
MMVFALIRLHLNNGFRENEMERIFLEGLFLQASLIFALGAQNIFVLESGLKKQNPLIISFICFFCDLLLIMVGVAGAGSIFSTFAQLKIIIGVIGVLFLFQYGFSKLFAKQGCLEELDESPIQRGIKRSILLAITFSLLNPHAYLDAFVLIGGYSTKYAVLSDRILIGLGAACFSLIWFLFLSTASTLMKPIFSNAKSLKLITTCSGLVLLFLSLRLGLDVYEWIINDPNTSVLVEHFSPVFASVVILSPLIY